jgi:hypothetical protein
MQIRGEIGSPCLSLPSRRRLTVRSSRGTLVALRFSLCPSAAKRSKPVRRRRFTGPEHRPSPSALLLRFVRVFRSQGNR